MCWVNKSMNLFSVSASKFLLNISSILAPLTPIDFSNEKCSGNFGLNIKWCDQLVFGAKRQSVPRAFYLCVLLAVKSCVKFLHALWMVCNLATAALVCVQRACIVSCVCCNSHILNPIPNMVHCQTCGIFDTNDTKKEKKAERTGDDERRRSVQQFV